MDFEPIFSQIQTGDPVGAAYKLAQQLGADATGRSFYEVGSTALSRRDELGESALRFARLTFAEAVERDPELGEAHHDLATTMRELGMAQDAIAHYKRALELLPDDVDCLIGLGAAQCDSGKIDDGIKTLKKATEMHPESGQAFANLGVAQEGGGFDEAAAGSYAKAVARFDAVMLAAEDDEDASDAATRRRWARIQHAQLLERLERWPQAVVEFRHLYEEEQAMAAAELEATLENEAREERDAEGEEGEEGDGPPSTLPIDEEMSLSEGLDEDDEDDELEGDLGGTLDQDELEAAGEDGDDDDDELDEDDDEELELDEDEDAGRLGLERVFARLVQQSRFDLAYIVLDDLGGELSDDRTRATYAIYDSGDGLPVIMVEHWEGGEREQLDPTGRKH